MSKRIPCEIFVRVVGYYRPYKNMNAGKIQEFKDRVEFSEKDSMNTKVSLPAKIPGEKTVLEQLMEKTVLEQLMEKADIIPSIGEVKKVVVGREFCSGCDNIKKQIEAGELKNTQYMSFSDLRDLRAFFVEIGETDDPVFPYEIEGELC